MNTAYIITGSNIGNAAHNLLLAKQVIIIQCGEVILQSHLYQTAAWGNTLQPDYVNQVLVVKTMLTPQQLLATVLGIEQQMGRVRTTLYAARIIDIDILFYNNQIINEPNLVVPHAQLQHRQFVLTPLAEIVPNKIHPVLHLPIKTLQKNCIDLLLVTKLETENT